MNNFLTSLLLVSALFFTACSENENNGEALSSLTVTLTSAEKKGDEVDSYSDFLITLTELKSGQKFESKANAEGIAKFSIAVGAYDIVAENMIDGVSTYYGVEKNYTVSDAIVAVSISVQNLVGTLEKSFVLDELYFNGDTNPDAYMGTMYEQYFTIRNISDRALYADGLSFGIAGDYNTLDVDSKMADLLPEEVVISQFYTIPGDGRTYKVEANESIVIAFCAINHKEGGTFGTDYPMDVEGGIYSVDLSGADFEIYVQGGMTPDNPEVPNVIVNFSTFQAFHWQYSGGSPMMLFRLTENADTFIENTKEIFDNPMSSNMQQDFLKLPTSYIIDVVRTGVIDGHFRNVIPVTADKEPFLVPSSGSYQEGFSGHFIYRKKITVDGVETVQDTNDSASDYILAEPHGQKSYPKQ